MRTDILLSLFLAGAAALGAGISSSSQQADASGELAEAAAQVLSKNCYGCHNNVKKEGGLSLQTQGALLAGGKHGAALLAGNSDESRMIQMVEGFLEPMMPDDGMLFDEEIETLRGWIDAGAPPWRGDLARLRMANLPDIQPAFPVEPAIASLAFSPRGDLLAAGTYQQVRLVDPELRKVVHTLDGHVETVRAVAFHPDGSRLAAAGGMPTRFGEIKIWRVSDGTLLSTLEGHNDCVYAVAFSPDGRLLASASYDQQIKIWNVESGEEVRTLSGHVDAVYDLAFDPNGDRLASTSADRTVKIWDVETGLQALRPLSESTGELYTLAYHPSGQFIAAAGADQMIRVWKLGAEGGELIRSAFAHESQILRLVYTPDGTTLISSGSDRRVKLWDAGDLKEIGELSEQADWVLALAVSPFGHLLALGRFDGTLGFFEVNSHETRQTAAR